MEHDHPQASDFLKMDCENVNAFFRKLGADVMTLRELYQYVTFDASSKEIEDSMVELLKNRYFSDLSHGHIWVVALMNSC